MRRIDKLHIWTTRLPAASAWPVRRRTAPRRGYMCPAGTCTARTSRRRFSASVMRMEKGRVSGFALLCSAPFERSGDMILSPYIEGERCLRDRKVSRRICSHSDNASKIWFDFSSEKSTNFHISRQFGSLRSPMGRAKARAAVAALFRFADPSPNSGTIFKQLFSLSLS